MDKKKSFIVFAPEFLALSNHLNLKQRGELMTALCEMVLYGEPMKPISQEISKAYDFMAESIKDNFSKYDAVCEKRRAIATKAASKRRANAEQKQVEKSANAKLNEDEDDNENDDKNKHEDDLNKKIKKEIKEKTNKKESSYLADIPSLEDVKIYCAVRGLKNINPQEFYDYYTAKHWKTGNKPITDWQAKVIKWAKGDEGLNSFSPIGDCFRLPKLARQGGVQ